MHFLLSALSIILIDLLLAGDNALVIAIAVRGLSGRERRIGIAAGAIAAVALRVGLTFFAARLLGIPYLQLAGGLFVLWIAVKMLLDTSAQPETASPASKRFWPAIWYIVVADVTMSVDNILAIAGASHGNLWLIVFGLAVSIPFIVLSSNLLSRLMDRWPVLVILGIGILGKVGGEMILTDPAVKPALDPAGAHGYLIEAGIALALIGFGWWRNSRRRAPQTG